MKIWSVIVGFVVLFGGPVSGYAKAYCDLETVVADYKVALKRHKIGDIDQAFKQFLPLAQAAVAPAQRYVARYYLEESYEDQAIEKGIMWAQLAAWGGDQEAAQRAKAAIEGARYAVSDKGQAMARNWRSSAFECARGQDFDEETVFKVVDGVALIKDEKVSDAEALSFALRLQEALILADQVAPYFSPLAQLVSTVRVVQDRFTDRFIEWNEEKGWLDVSLTYRNDETARQLSYALMLAMQRQIFAQVEDAEFVDQVADRYGKVKIYGSLYGDVGTKRFIELVKDAYVAVRDLPVRVRDKINLLDEIHYMPPSRYHRSRLTPDKDVARYDVTRSGPERRVGVIGQEITFETPQELALYLVKLGAFAHQNLLIEQYQAELNGEGREDAILKALEGNMQAAQALFSDRLADRQKIVTRWYEKGPSEMAEFQCQAAVDQVKAALALKVQNISVTKIINFKGCKEARTLWQQKRS